MKESTYKVSQMVALITLRWFGNLRTKQTEHSDTFGFAECDRLCRVWGDISVFIEKHMEWLEMLSMACHTALCYN